MRTVLILGLGAALLPGLAGAVMHPMYYRQARMEAAHHVQVHVLRVTGPRGGVWGDCTIQGRVARVFKGDLKPGARIRLTTNCVGPRNGPTPVGGALPTETVRLRKAKVIEAFLSGTPADIVQDQAVILPRLTDTPACNPAQEGFRCEPIVR